MKISIISPTHRSGATTSTALIASALAFMQGVDTTILYTGAGKNIKRILDVTQQNDPTKSISQVYKLINSNSIANSDIIEYATEIRPNLHIMSTEDSRLKEEQQVELVEKVFSTITTPITICDINLDPYDEVAQRVMKVSDLVLISVNQDIKSLEAIKKWRSSEFWPETKAMLLVSKFDGYINSLRDCAHFFGFKYTDTCKISYNPTIAKKCNNNAILQATSAALRYETDVIELNNDLKEICGAVCTTGGIRFKWEKPNVRK